MTRTQSEPIDAALSTIEVFGNAHALLHRSAQAKPFVGWVAADRHDHVLLLDEAPDAVWEFAGASHIYGARDVVRTCDGLVAVGERCLGVLREWIDDHAWHSGEIVTVIVSTLRGLTELGARQVTNQGQWWLAGDGRPVFVLGPGKPATLATRELVHTLSTATQDHALQRTLCRLHSALEDPLAALPQFDTWEQELLDLAAPRPLRLEKAETPGALPEVQQHRCVTLGTVPAYSADESSPPLRRRDRHSRSFARPAPGWAGPAMLVDRARGAIARIPRVPTTGPSGRRPRPSLVAAAAAALVCTIGVLWPDTGATARAEPDASLQRSLLLASAHQTARGEPTEASEASVVIDIDAGTVHLPPNLLAEVLGVEMPETAAEIIEHYGDVIVARVVTDSAHTIVVLERRDENWLLRDAYDVAEQPADDPVSEP